jgi:4-hydroxy-L-threonine phosphate dehydrogenase PdxA
VRAVRGDYDAVIAVRPRPGADPVKLVAFDKVVNVTLGLPVVRTSVDHGRVFDVAGRVVADPSRLIEAIKLRARLARGARR